MGLDPRTGRPFGDHGSAADAIDYALEVSMDPACFLYDWRTGDLDDWPEFYVWLAKREVPLYD